MSFRSEQAEAVRISAAALARARGLVAHVANGEEYEYRTAGTMKAGRPTTSDRPTHIANFTKGLPHDVTTGLLKNPVDYQLFIRGIDSGSTADFLATPLGPAADVEVPPGCRSVAAIRCDAPPTETAWESDVAETGGFPHNERPGPVSVRAWESAGAGLTFDLEGPDAQAVTMPPAPRLDSPELAAEMAEIYAQALLRDTHVSHLRDEVEGNKACDATAGGPRDLTGFSVEDAIQQLGLQSEWFGLSDRPQPAGVRLARRLDNSGDFNTPAARPLTEAECARLRPTPTRQTIFRGVAPGDQVGPYLSQLLLIGNSGVNAVDQDRTLADGLISYGAVTINQRVRFVHPTLDYMTSFAEYIDVQNGARLNGLEEYVRPDDHTCDKVAGGKRGKGEEQWHNRHPGYRFITTPRDLATYVHYDALYEAYLNACLLMLGLGVPFDRGLPFQRDDVADHQAGFAQFGGPHILTLVCEVATRALKAVRFQKFNVHRRLRPEALAGRIAKYEDHKTEHHALDPFAPIKPIFDRLDRAPKGGQSILAWVKEHNRLQNGGGAKAEKLPLLPMAFPEGSPMHPSYGAGHATVAGACVTILKAFFDAGTELWEAVEPKNGNKSGKSYARPICYEPTPDGCRLVSLLEPNVCKPGAMTEGGKVRSLGRRGPEQADWLPVPAEEAKLTRKFDFKALTVEGELNKLAANISIGRDWAGVHYYTDYLESLRLGEKIAIGLLEEQKLTYRENFSMTVPLFDGGSVRI